MSFEFFFSLSLPSSNVNIPNIRRQTINVSPPINYPRNFDSKKVRSSIIISSPVATCRAYYVRFISYTQRVSIPSLSIARSLKGAHRGRGRPRKIHSYRSKYLAADGRLREALTMNDEYIRGMKAGWMRHLNGHDRNGNVDGPETSSSAEFSEGESGFLDSSTILIDSRSSADIVVY